MWRIIAQNFSSKAAPLRLGERPTRHRHVLAEGSSICTRGWETAPSASKLAFSSPPVSQNRLLPGTSYCTATWSRVEQLIPARDPSVRQPGPLMKLWSHHQIAAGTLASTSVNTHTSTPSANLLFSCYWITGINRQHINWWPYSHH